MQWSALCLTHWRPRLNFCGKHNIFNFKRNAIMSIAHCLLSYITSDIIKLQISVGSGESCELPPLETGVQDRLMSSVGRLLSLFLANYEVKYNDCVDFIRCLDGALISLEVDTLNSSGSDSRKIVDRGTTVVFLLVVMKKNIRDNIVVFLWSS